MLRLAEVFAKITKFESLYHEELIQKAPHSRILYDNNNTSEALTRKSFYFYKKQQVETKSDEPR